MPLVNQEHEHQPTMMECIQELIDTGVLDKKDIVRLKKTVNRQKDEVKVIFELADVIDELSIDNK